MTTKPKNSIPQTTESSFIDKARKTCGAPFLALFTNIDVQKINDFVVGRLSPVAHEMDLFIAALGEFNRLTRVELRS